MNVPDIDAGVDGGVGVLPPPLLPQATNNAEQARPQSCRSRREIGSEERKPCIIPSPYVLNVDVEYKHAAGGIRCVRRKVSDRVFLDRHGSAFQQTERLWLGPRCTLCSPPHNKCQRIFRRGYPVRAVGNKILAYPLMSRLGMPINL